MSELRKGAGSDSLEHWTNNADGMMAHPTTKIANNLGNSLTIRRIER